MTFSSRCLLRDPCNKRDGAECSKLCASYIAVHGLNGTGGRIAAANVPDSYARITLSTSPAREAMTPSPKGDVRVYGIIADYVPTFARQFDAESPPIKSLYLYSREPGTGKTTTAAAVLNEWLIVHYIGSIQRGRKPLERPAYFIDVNAWQTDYNAFNRPRVPDDIAAPAAARYYAAQRIAASVPFLVADDVGVRDASEAFRADLHTVINARVAAGLPTVYTSNIALSELPTLFDRRLADRVREQCLEISFVGTSKRGMR